MIINYFKINIYYKYYIFVYGGKNMTKPNFEKNMSDLENIVTELEKGDLNLDESISKFEEGIKISKECNKILEDAEKKITILLQKDGEVKEENFVSEE